MLESDTSSLKSEEEREEYQYWLRRGLNILTRREHSIMEFRFKLVSRDCPEHYADQIIDYCQSLNYLNEERFAYSHAKNRADLGYGPIRVRYELQEHKIADRFITKAFREISWDDARQVAERRIRQTDELKRKQALYRRGFRV